MKPISDAGTVVAAMQRLRRPGAGHTSNCFASPEQLQAWAVDGRLLAEETGEAVLLFRRDRDFHHVLHAAAGLDALSGALARLAAVAPPTPLVADLVGRPDEADGLEERYRAAGFARRAELVRMSRVGSPVVEVAPDPAVRLAAAADAPKVLAFLERLLDRYAEQIPELAEIESAIARGTVVVAHLDGDLAGVVYFERSGLTVMLRYWWLDPGCRERGLGSRLLREYFRACADARRLVLWVMSDNRNAIAKYRHYGFQTEPLVDRIVFREGAKS